MADIRRGSRGEIELQPLASRARAILTELKEQSRKEHPIFVDHKKDLYNKAVCLDSSGCF